MEPVACAREILCRLGTGFVEAFKAQLLLQRAVLNAPLTAARSKAALLTLRLAPLEAARAAAEQVVNTTILAVEQAVPAPNLGNCLPLAQYKQTVVSTARSAVAEASILLDQVDRLLTLRDEVEVIIAEIEAQLARIDALIAGLSLGC